MKTIHFQGIPQPRLLDAVVHVLDGAAGPGRLELTEEMKQGATGTIHGKSIGSLGKSMIIWLL